MPSVRRADELDSKDIFDWRNDALTRRMSHSTDLVEWDAHMRWFAASLSNPNRLLIICEDENSNAKVAVVRFDIKSVRALISINLSPNMRGKGKAKQCLKDSIALFQTICPKVRFIDAEIKPINTASQHSFIGVGFTLLGEKEGVLRYEYVI